MPGPFEWVPLEPNPGPSGLGNLLGGTDWHPWEPAGGIDSVIGASQWIWGQITGSNPQPGPPTPPNQGPPIQLDPNTGLILPGTPGGLPIGSFPMTPPLPPPLVSDTPPYLPLNPGTGPNPQEPPSIIYPALPYYPNYPIGDPENDVPS